MNRHFPLLFVLALGCGGPASTAAVAPAPATPTPVAPAPVAPASAASASAPASEVSATPSAAALGFTELDLRPALSPPLAYPGTNVVVEDGRPLIFVDAERFVVVDEQASARVVPNPFGFQRRGDHGRPIPAAGGAFLIEGRGGLVAVDRETLQARWTSPVPPSPSEAHLFSAGSAFVVQELRGLTALDPTDGRELWRRETTANGRCDAMGHGLVVCTDWDVDVALAINARTGRERFRVPVPNPQVSAMTAYGLGVFESLEPGARGPETFVVVGLEGRTRRSLVLDAPIDSAETIVVGEHEVAVVVRPERHAVAVRRYALESEGAPVTSAPLASSGVGERELALVSGALLFRDDAYVVRALGPELRESWLGQPPTGCWALHPWAPRQGAPTSFVCLGERPSLYRATATLPARRTISASGVVRCEGRLLPRAMVQIGGALTETDAAGRYRVETTVDTGTVGVGLPVAHYLNDMVYCYGPIRFVETDGGEVHADIDVEENWGGLDGL